jgi:hypothetical protein
MEARRWRKSLERHHPLVEGSYPRRRHHSLLTSSRSASRADLRPHTGEILLWCAWPCARVEFCRRSTTSAARQFRGCLRLRPQRQSAAQWPSIRLKIRSDLAAYAYLGFCCESEITAAPMALESLPAAAIYQLAGSLQPDLPPVPRTSAVRAVGVLLCAMNQHSVSERAAWSRSWNGIVPAATYPTTGHGCRCRPTAWAGASSICSISMC